MFLLHLTINITKHFYFSSEICNYRASGHGVIETVLKHTVMSCAASWFWK